MQVDHRQLGVLPLYEIIEAMNSKEKKYRLCSYKNATLGHCRFILVEWMVEICEDFRLNNLTVHSAIGIFGICLLMFIGGLLDRVLLSTEVAKSKLQLIAITCILLAGM